MFRGSITAPITLLKTVRLMMPRCKNWWIGRREGSHGLVPVGTTGESNA